MPTGTQPAGGELVDQTVAAVRMEIVADHEGMIADFVQVIRSELDSEGISAGSTSIYDLNRRIVLEDEPGWLRGVAKKVKSQEPEGALTRQVAEQIVFDLETRLVGGGAYDLVDANAGARYISDALVFGPCPDTEVVQDSIELATSNALYKYSRWSNSYSQMHEVLDLHVQAIGAGVFPDRANRGEIELARLASMKNRVISFLAAIEVDLAAKPNYEYLGHDQLRYMNTELLERIADVQAALIARLLVPTPAEDGQGFGYIKHAGAVVGSWGKRPQTQTSAVPDVEEQRRAGFDRTQPGVRVRQGVYDALDGDMPI